MLASVLIGYMKIGDGFFKGFGISIMKGCLNSSYTFGRWCGSLLKQASMKFLRLGETMSLLGSFGGSVALAIESSTETISYFSDQGGFPTKSSKTVHPKLHMSAYLLCPVCFTTSGGIQYGVPHSEIKFWFYIIKSSILLTI